MSTLGDTMEPYSEMPSELSIEGDELQVSSLEHRSPLTCPITVDAADQT
jgi:hypothetical protein